MEKRDYQKVLDSVADPKEILPDLSTEKMWMLLGELDSIERDYERDLAINYISSNCSNSKHMCQTVLRGKPDEYVKQTLVTLRDAMHSEIESRRTKRSK